MSDQKLETKETSIDQLVGDPKIRPQDDFYHHVCSAWIKANPRPTDFAVWDQFRLLTEKVLVKIAEIINDWEKTDRDQLTDPQKQVVDFYQTVLAKEELTGNGLATLVDIHQTYIANLTFDNLGESLASLDRIGVNLLWDVDIEVDMKDRSRHSLYIGQPELSLPDRDYYLQESDNFKQKRQAYHQFITSFSQALLETIGLEFDQSSLKKSLRDQDRLRDDVFNFEVKLAKMSWELVDVFNPSKSYNPYSWDKFSSDFKFDWRGYFQTLGRIPSDLIVAQPSYLTKLLDFLEGCSIQTIKRCLTWRLILVFAKDLNERLSLDFFNFYGRKLAGQPQIKPLPKRALYSTNHCLADTIGQEYIRRHYPTDHQDKIDHLTEVVSSSLRDRLKDIKWLSPESRLYAQKKLDGVIVNLARGANWHQYVGFEIDRKNLIQTYLNLVEFKTDQAIDLLDRQPSRVDFPNSGQYGSQTVTAWTSHVLLNTNYPAAILQPPFYDHRASFAANLGGIGSVIGHELIHQFDRSGTKYDHQGSFNPWFSDQDQKLFGKAIQPLIDSANNYKIDQDVYINGELVIGEFLADVCGLAVVIDVIKKQNLDSKSQKVALKQLFKSYAYHWAGNFAQESRIQRVKTDPHPDIVFRVNGVLPHIPEFYDVYDVQPSDKMFLPENERAVIW